MGLRYIIRINGPIVSPLLGSVMFLLGLHQDIRSLSQGTFRYSKAPSPCPGEH